MRSSLPALGKIPIGEWYKFNCRVYDCKQGEIFVPSDKLEEEIERRKRFGYKAPKMNDIKKPEDNAINQDPSSGGDLPGLGSISSGKGSPNLPPPPPGYSKTWIRAPTDMGRLGWGLIDPDRNAWVTHAEDKGHWRHWDKYDNNSGKKSRKPKNSVKPWPNQKNKLPPNKSWVDPSGDSKPIEKNTYPNVPIPIIPGKNVRVPFPSIRIPVWTPVPTPVIVIP